MRIHEHMKVYMVILEVKKYEQLRASSGRAALCSVLSTSDEQPNAPC
jgi:hypothetical protein